MDGYGINVVETAAIVAEVSEERRGQNLGIEGCRVLKILIKNLIYSSLGEGDTPFVRSTNLLMEFSEKKLDRRQWNQLLDAVGIILKYKKIAIYHTIYIKILSDGKISYITVYTNYFLNTHNN